MRTKVMLDLETLGTNPNSVILAIGAVKFNNENITDAFYARINAESCISFGLQMDVSTVMWWLHQSEDARQEVTRPGYPLDDVLTEFTSWINNEDVEVWGNGSDFDNVILANAYLRAEIPCPWKHVSNRCYRTIKNHFPVISISHTGTLHNALDDAKSQALHLIQILSLNKTP